MEQAAGQRDQGEEGPGAGPRGPGVEGGQRARPDAGRPERGGDRDQAGQHPGQERELEDRVGLAGGHQRDHLQVQQAARDGVEHQPARGHERQHGRRHRSGESEGPQDGRTPARGRQGAERDRQRGGSRHQEVEGAAGEQAQQGRRVDVGRQERRAGRGQGRSQEGEEGPRAHHRQGDLPRLAGRSGGPQQQRQGRQRGQHAPVAGLQHLADLGRAGRHHPHQDQRVAIRTAQHGLAGAQGGIQRREVRRVRSLAHVHVDRFHPRVPSGQQVEVVEVLVPDVAARRHGERGGDQPAQHAIRPLDGRDRDQRGGDAALQDEDVVAARQGLGRHGRVADPAGPGHHRQRGHGVDGHRRPVGHAVPQLLELAEEADEGRAVLGERGAAVRQRGHPPAQATDALHQLGLPALQLREPRRDPPLGALRRVAGFPPHVHAPRAGGRDQGGRGGDHGQPAGPRAAQDGQHQRGAHQREAPAVQDGVEADQPDGQRNGEDGEGAQPQSLAVSWCGRSGGRKGHLETMLRGAVGRVNERCSRPSRPGRDDASNC